LIKSLGDRQHTHRRLAEAGSQMPGSQVQVTNSKLTDAQAKAIVSTLADRKVTRIQEPGDG